MAKDLTIDKATVWDYYDQKAVIADGPAELTHTPGSTTRNLLICHGCGQQYIFTYPIAIAEMTSLIDHFTKHHSKCEKK